MSGWKASLISVTFALVAASSTYARQKPGHERWPAGATIAVWIDSAAPAGAADYVERAMKVWTDAAAGRFVLRRTPSELAAAVRVRFTRPDGVFGRTLPRRDSHTGFLVAADVMIVSVADGDALQGRIVTYLTALHELGHALGLGHSDDFADIMYSFRRPGDGDRYFAAFRSRLHSAKDIGSPAATGLSRGDIETLLSIYGG
jgi:hypothetical protein